VLGHGLISLRAAIVELAIDFKANEFCSGCTTGATTTTNAYNQSIDDLCGGHSRINKFTPHRPLPRLYDHITTKEQRQLILDNK